MDMATSDVIYEKGYWLERLKNVVGNHGYHNDKLGIDMSLSDMSMRHSVIYHAALDQNKQTHANTCVWCGVGQEGE